MLKINKDILLPVIPSHPETEEELIARIRSGHGYDDEYTDKYHKTFPKE